MVAEQARHLADSAAGIVLLPDEEGGMEIVAVSSDRPSGALGVVVPPESRIIADLLDGRAVFIDDAATDPRIMTDLARGYGPAMMLPLQSDGRVLGTLVTPRERGARPFTEAERTLAAQFASQAALALMMAEAQRDRERLAVYEDRDRIARDLHDLVIQRLFATGMMLESAQRRSVVPEVQQGVGQAVDELDVTIQEIRTAIFALQQGPAEAPAACAHASCARSTWRPCRSASSPPTTSWAPSTQSSGNSPARTSSRRSARPSRTPSGTRRPPASTSSSTPRWSCRTGRGACA
ncbi:histidine kinase [Streptomyces alboflavus]|uniref:Histidine kinase n=1 Tax=Streptomyces alboflavus TaxID=67267 RepID=A0A1Z1WEL3_9ACTN|nr:histidine kinase [Streptomyces alboflavus]